MADDHRNSIFMVPEEVFLAPALLRTIFVRGEITKAHCWGHRHYRTIALGSKKPVTLRHRVTGKYSSPEPRRASLLPK